MMPNVIAAALPVSMSTTGQTFPSNSWSIPTSRGFCGPLSGSGFLRKLGNSIWGHMNVDLVVANGTFGWPEKLDRPNRVHWLWLRGETRSRRNVRRLLPVRLRPLRKVVANPDGTLTVTDTLINTFGQ